MLLKKPKPKLTCSFDYMICAIQLKHVCWLHNNIFCTITLICGLVCLKQKHYRHWRRRFKASNTCLCFVCVCGGGGGRWACVWFCHPDQWVWSACWSPVPFELIHSCRRLMQEITLNNTWQPNVLNTCVCPTWTHQPFCFIHDCLDIPQHKLTAEGCSWSQDQQNIPLSKESNKKPTKQFTPTCIKSQNFHSAGLDMNKISWYREGVPCICQWYPDYWTILLHFTVKRNRQISVATISCNHRWMLPDFPWPTCFCLFFLHLICFFSSSLRTGKVCSTSVLGNLPAKCSDHLRYALQTAEIKMKSKTLLFVYIYFPWFWLPLRIFTTKHE